MFQNNSRGNQINNQTNNVNLNAQNNINYNINKESNIINHKRIHNLINTPNNNNKNDEIIIHKNKFIDYMSGNDRNTLNLNNNNISLYRTKFNNSEIKAFNIESPYKNKTENHYNFSSESTDFGTKCSRCNKICIHLKKFIIVQQTNIHQFCRLNIQHRK